jgi:hypothetical protein
VEAGVAGGKCFRIEDGAGLGDGLSNDLISGDFGKLVAWGEIEFIKTRPRHD